MEQDALVLLGEDSPAIVAAVEGDTLELRLAHADGINYGWKTRGGPPGIFVRSDGTIDYDLGPDSVGRWWVEVRHGWGPLNRRAGFELRIEPASGSGLPRDAPLTPPQPRPLIAGHLRCGLGLGAAAGVSIVTGSSWRHVGRDPVEAAFSPALLGQCSFGEAMQPSLGFETQPLLQVPDFAQPVAATVGLDVQRERWTVGAFVSVHPQGLLEMYQGALPGDGLGLGARVQLSLPSSPLLPGGPELRASFIDGLGPRASLSWWWTLDLENGQKMGRSHKRMDPS